MLNTIWFFMIALSIIYAAASGRLPLLSDAIMEGAGDAVTHTIVTLGSICAWLGFLKIAEDSGLTDLLAKAFSKPIDFLFPEYKHDKSIKGKICMNLSANLLGLGNAATPLGLSAMKAMEEKNPNNHPTKGMLLFVIINTASLQVLPINMAAIRQSLGSVSPFSIVPYVWITSAAALFVCIFACKIAERKPLWNV